jgi:hypothetical protein
MVREGGKRGNERKSLTAAAATVQLSLSSAFKIFLSTTHYATGHYMSRGRRRRRKS